jgi:hypothetical protein
VWFTAAVDGGNSRTGEDCIVPGSVARTKHELRERMAISVRIEGQNLKVTISGWDTFWALKRSLTIPLDHVVGASVEPVSNKMGWKVAGTGIPGGIKAGWFRAKGQNEFWLVHKRTEALEIKLRDEKYVRLMLQVEDPEATAETINSIIGAPARRAA